MFLALQIQGSNPPLDFTFNAATAIYCGAGFLLGMMTMWVIVQLKMKQMRGKR
jgi:hypothetical protein